MPYVSPYRPRGSRTRTPSPPRQQLYTPPRQHRPPRWNNQPQFKKRRRVAVLIIGALLAIIILVIGLVLHSRSTPDTSPHTQSHTHARESDRHTSPQTTAPTDPDSLSKQQLSRIPQKPVLIIAVPGTWEVHRDSDPRKPAGLLKSVLVPVSKHHASTVGTFTLPYPAQFKNVNNRHDMTYNDSRSAGVTRLLQTIETYLSNVPDGHIIILGFSQGAVIAGDTLTAIGNNKTSISPYSITGGILVADGRRETRYGHTLGAQHVSQNGLEVELAHIPQVSSTVMKGTDAVMTGSRREGFGVLRSRVTHICQPGDTICDAPPMATLKDALVKSGDVIAWYKKHAEYGHRHMDSLGGLTAPQWMVLRTDKLVKIILAEH